MTKLEMEFLLIEGKSKKEIIDNYEVSEKEYRTKLDAVMKQYSELPSNQSRIHYINQIEKLFFVANEMYHSTDGLEKLNWNIKRNELGRVYSTYNAVNLL